MDAQQVSTSGSKSDCISIVSLPLYESKATPEERQQQLGWMAKQYRLIRGQEQEEVPVTRVKIRCGCNKIFPWIYMYRCLYCGIWFCKECAEIHFGAKVPPPFEGVQR